MQHLTRRKYLIGNAATLLAIGMGRYSFAEDILSAAPVPPVTPKRPVCIRKFGHSLRDDYRWLKQPGWFQSIGNPSALDPEIRAHLEAEEAYCDAVLEGTRPLQAELVREMRERMAEDENDFPTVDGPWEYFTRQEPGARFPVYMRRPVGGGEEEILLDVAAEARGRDYYRITAMRAPHASPDHRYFAWMADDTGDERYNLTVKDLETGEILGAPIGDGYGQYEFSTDSQWIYWVYRDEMSRPVRVLRRPVAGGPVETVIEETDPAFFLGLNLTASKAYLLIRSNTADSSEVRFVKNGDEPRLIESRTPGLRYTVEHWRDDFVILTNADNAIDFKVVVASEKRPARQDWRELVPHRKGRYITLIQPFREYLARLEWIDALPAIVILDAKGREKTLPGRHEAYDISLADREGEYDTSKIRYSYSSPVTPPEWREYDAETGRDQLIGKQEASWFDPTRYRLERIQAPAADGAQVPITVLMPEDVAPDGTAPVMLYTYGAYGSSRRARFSVHDFSLVDRGWIVATAHVRGGSERGATWYLDGRALHKRNTITDYIACAEHLISEGYTEAKQIVGHSFSAGGIPVGGAINLRPDLWAGVIGQVPFVDVLNSIHDPDNPLLYIEYPEWGDPSDKEVFEYVLSYSPYENVRPQAYPAVLATVGLLDDRVGYWEGSKWIARLRELTTSDNPVMLKTYWQAGHQGMTGRLAQLQQTALFFAFATWAIDEARNSH